MIRIAALPLCVLLAVVTLLSGATCGSAQSDQRPMPSRSFIQVDSATAFSVIDVDDVWTGIPVRYKAVRSGSSIVVGYYNKDRFMTVAIASINGGPVARVILPSKFWGWDVHNYFALAVDKTGTIHVAANMHSQKLNYFRIEEPYGDGSGQRAAMIGTNEDEVTYPHFFHTGAGDLVFGYRDGRSGDGTWLFNKWDGQHWTRLVSGATFSDRHGSESVNAYPCFVQTADGTFHVAIQWRKRGGISENFRLTYARTNDFINWQRLDDRPITLPISADNSDTVVDTGSNMALRSCDISVDPSGRPVIAFTHYADDGPNAGYVARGDTTGWQIVEVARTNRRFAMTGEGVGIRAISVTPRPVIFNDRTPVACFRLRDRGDECRSLDPETLQPTAVVAATSPKIPLEAADSTEGLASPVVNYRPVDDGYGNPTGAFIVWPTQTIHRGPWRCTTETPRACEPPPKRLRIVVPKNWAESAK